MGLQTLVVDGSWPNLLGRDSLRVLRLNWKKLFKRQVDENKQESLLGSSIDQYSEVFRKGLGTFTGPRIKIHVETKAKLMFLKVRPVPYAMTE